jgi:hypothetical protein
MTEPNAILESSFDCLDSHVREAFTDLLPGGVSRHIDLPRVDHSSEVFASPEVGEVATVSRLVRWRKRWLGF